MTHRPVLLPAVVEALKRGEGLYLDATVGAGGHAAALLEAMPEARLIALDRDPQALALARDRLAGYGGRVRFVRRNFAELAEVLAGETLAGALFDLGVSSMQLDDPERGFSFRGEGPLDMRMGPDAPYPASELIERASVRELEHVLKAYGEERFARRIARAIVAHRPLRTTRELAELIERVVPARRGARIHPATRTFQALRIAVNDELAAIPPGLEAAFAALRPGGRLAVITFHSLEDRLVKRFLREKARGCVCPPDLPRCVCGREPEARLFKPITPTSEEIAANPRARSARLRVAEKLAGDERLRRSMSSRTRPSIVSRAAR